jgi:hypothetical protein
LFTLTSGKFAKSTTVYATHDEGLNVLYYNGVVYIPQVRTFNAASNLLGETDVKEIPLPAGETPLPVGETPSPAKETPKEITPEEEVVYSDRYPPGSYDFWFCLIVAVLLTLGAGAMSGLTVGYLSIDQLELEMKLQNGTEEEKKYALAVLPVLEDHHYLLVTLLFANALCMEALPIYLDSIVPSAYAILISVLAVLFFGEVIPQAICTGPQQIRIGAALAPYVQLLKI